MYGPATPSLHVEAVADFGWHAMFVAGMLSLGPSVQLKIIGILTMSLSARIVLTSSPRPSDAPIGRLGVGETQACSML
jgi:hypothetical protein